MGLYTNRIFDLVGGLSERGGQALRARKAMGRPERLDAKQIPRDLLVEALCAS